MKNKAKKYLLITFGISWISWFIVLLFIRMGIASYPDFLTGIIGILGVLGPTIASIILLDGKKNFKNILNFIFKHNKKSYLTLIIFSIILILSYAFTCELDKEIPFYLIIPLFMYAITLGGGFEELGWRGVLQPNLEKQFSFPISCIITGIVWGVWHAPLKIIQGFALFDIAFFPFVIGTIAFSFFLAYIYKKTNSVFYCAFFHGLYNTLATVFITDAWSLIIELLLAIISIILYYREIKDMKN